MFKYASLKIIIVLGVLTISGSQAMEPENAPVDFDMVVELQPEPVRPVRRNLMSEFNASMYTDTSDESMDTD